VCKKLIKNSQPFGKNFQKTLGGIFLTHTVEYWDRQKQNRCYGDTSLVIYN